MDIQDLKDIICIVSNHFNENVNFPEKFMTSIQSKLQNGQRNTSEDIVLEVFDEMGKNEMIPFFQTYVKEKEIIYQSLKKAKTKVTLLVGPTSNDEYIPWETNKIARALEREGGIPKNVSEQVAHAVEDKVIQSGIRHINTILIRELVNSELFLSGYGYYMKKQSVLGIPKYNLNNVLYPKNDESKVTNINYLSHLIAENTFRQYVLDEVFSKEVIQAHLSGFIHIEDLEWSVKFFSISGSFPQKYYLTKGEETIENLVRVLSNMEKVANFASNSFYLYDIDQPEIYWNKYSIRSFVHSIANKNYTNLEYYIVLKNIDSTYLDNFAKSFKETSQQHFPNMCLPLLTENISNDKYLKKLYNVYQVTGNIYTYFQNHYFFNDEQKPFIDSTMSSFVINLFRIAQNIGNDYDKLWLELKKTFDLIVKAHLDKKRFLFNLGNGALKELLDPEQNLISQINIRNASCYLAIAGLPEAIHYLCQSDMSEGEGWQLAIEILSRLNEMVFNLEAMYDIRIRLVDYKQSRSTKRFAKLDKSLELEKQFQHSEYTFGPHFSNSTVVSDQEKISKEGQLHHYMHSYTTINGIKDFKSFRSLLQFTLEETNALMLHFSK